MTFEVPRHLWAWRGYRTRAPPPSPPHARASSFSRARGQPRNDRNGGPRQVPAAGRGRLPPGHRRGQAARLPEGDQQADRGGRVPRVVPHEAEQRFDLADLPEGVALADKRGPPQVDFLLCPTAPTLPPPLDAVLAGQARDDP